VTLGTFDYISPEQARDPRDADVRSDLYSLGCTLFYMLTGQPPFPDGTALQKLLNHGSQPPPDPRQWRDDISDQLYAVLAKLMAKRPADRYQKPLELINDLLLIAQLEGLPRSRSPGSILMRATVAQRTLLETHLPWLVPMSVLLVSAFWLQSADSLTGSLELPIPTLRGPLTSAASATDLSESRDGRGQDSTRTGSDGQLTPPRESVPAAPQSTTPAIAAPRGTASSPVIEPPLLAEAFEQDAAASSASEQRSPTSAEVSGRPGVPLPLVAGPQRAQEQGALDLSAEGLSASAAQALTRLRNGASAAAMPGGTPAAGPGDGSGESASATTPALNSSAMPGDIVLPGSGLATGPATVGSSASQPTSTESIEGSIEPRLPSPLTRDTIIVSRTEPSAASSGALWSSSLSEALARAAMTPEVRIIELRESIELNHVIAIPRSGLTLRGAPGVQVVLSGEQAYGMGWESWIEVQRVALRCERIDFACLNDMHQAQAIFALRAGGQLELVECVATMASNHGAPLGACVLVNEPERQRNPSLSLPPAGSSDDRAESGNAAVGTESQAAVAQGAALPGSQSQETNHSVSVGSGSSAGGEPVTIALSGCVIRGNQNLISMRTACRAEITLDETCAMLEGRVLTIRGLEHDRMPPVVRLDMELSTLVSRQGFASVQTGFALRAPLTLMRTAKLCAFWSPSMVPHITIDGIADRGVLDELLQLRGEDNAYDQNIETLCQCRFADGKHIDYSFRDAPGEWFRERGNDTSLRWQNAVPADRPLEEQLPEDYRLRAGMFVPGFPPSATTPPRLDSDAQD
jgi:serine/threonine-protein kinase